MQERKLLENLEYLFYSILFLKHEFEAGRKVRARERCEKLLEDLEYSNILVERYLKEVKFE